MCESLVCCSILRNLLISEDYHKSIDKAEHTNKPVSSSFYNAIVDVLAEMINIDIK